MIEIISQPTPEENKLYEEKKKLLLRQRISEEQQKGVGESNDNKYNNLISALEKLYAQSTV